MAQKKPNAEVLKVIQEKGLLLEKEIFDFFSSSEDVYTARTLLDSLEVVSGQKMISVASLNKMNQKYLNIKIISKFINDYFQI